MLSAKIWMQEPVSFRQDLAPEVVVLTPELGSTLWLAWILEWTLERMQALG